MTDILCPLIHSVSPAGFYRQGSKADGRGRIAATMARMTMKAAPRLPSLTFSDRASAGVLVPTGDGMAATALALATVSEPTGVGVATTALVLATVLVPTGAGVATAALVLATVLVPKVVVLLTRAGERHPASNVAATTVIGMMLRILERSNVQCWFSNPRFAV